MEIIVISQNGCVPCQHVKHFLNSTEVEYTEVNISEDSSAIEKYGIMSTPVTILKEGDEEIKRASGSEMSKIVDIVETYTNGGQ